MKLIFRGEEVEVEPTGGIMNVDFNGHYLIEVDGYFIPTGAGIDGYGNPLHFNSYELIIKEK